MLWFGASYIRLDGRNALVWVEKLHDKLVIFQVSSVIWRRLEMGAGSLGNHSYHKFKVWSSKPLTLMEAIFQFLMLGTCKCNHQPEQGGTRKSRHSFHKIGVYCTIYDLLQRRKAWENNLEESFRAICVSAIKTVECLSGFEKIWGMERYLGTYVLAGPNDLLWP